MPRAPIRIDISGFSKLLVNITRHHSSYGNGMKATTLKIWFRTAQLGQNICVKKPTCPGSRRAPVEAHASVRYELSMWRDRHGRNQGFISLIALEATELVLRDDDNLLPPMHCDMLRPFAAGAPHQFTEARLGVLQPPAPRRLRGSWSRNGGFSWSY